MPHPPRSAKPDSSIIVVSRLSLSDAASVEQVRALERKLFGNGVAWTSKSDTAALPIIWIIDAPSPPPPYTHAQNHTRTRAYPSSSHTQPVSWHSQPPSCFPAATFDREVQRRNTSVFCVAEAGSGRVLGYIVCTTSSLVLHISKLAVVPEARRRGIASALLQVPAFSALLECFMRLNQRKQQAKLC